MKKANMDLLSGSLWDKILMFALPLAASNILQQFFNSADMAVVGQFSGKAALAAVGSNNSIINLLINLFNDVLSGALRGLGKSLVPALISVFGICDVRFIWIYGVLPHSFTYENLLLVYPVSWTITTFAVAVAFVIYSKKILKKKKGGENLA